jgi:outer membrane protein assembly factor BamB
MASTASDDRKPRRELRLWPGVAAAFLLLIARFVMPRIVPDGGVIGILGAMLFALVILLWWLLFSRAAWVDRLGVPVVMLAAGAAAMPLTHPSIQGGMMGMMFGMLALPMMCAALVAALVASRGWPLGRRRALVAAAIVLVCVGFTTIRTGGMSGAADSDIAWRWTPTPEERLLALEGKGEAVQAKVQAAPTPSPEPAAISGPPVAPIPAEPAAPIAIADAAPAAAPAPVAQEAVAPASVTPAEWPGFRGPRRDGMIPGTTIAKDWSTAPPKEVWRRPVGPAWSSFAVHGDFIYTQEQRGEDEAVACYRASTGEPVWKHGDAARFWESNAGAGPRGTPTLAGGRVYTFGGTGILNALDAATGEVVWTRQAAADAKATTPTWGFSSSPLVLGDLVLVAVSGQLVAYDLATGATRWSGPAGGASYSSPQLVTLDGVPQILLLSKTGLASMSPADGTVLWEHAWTGYPIVQPGLMPDGDVLISVSDSSGLRRLAVAEDAGAWKVEERWTATPTASTAASCPASTSPTASASGKAAATARAS